VTVSPARVDALALVTAHYFGITEGLDPVLADWVDGDAGHERSRILAGQLAFWAATLFTLTCQARGLDPERTRLAVPIPAGSDPGVQQDATAAVVAVLAHRGDILEQVYRNRLTADIPAARRREYLLAATRIAANLVEQAAERQPTPGALLERLGAVCAGPAPAGPTPPR